MQIPAHSRGKVITFDFDHDAALDIAPPSGLKLLEDWPASKVPALSRSIYRLPCSRQSTPVGGRIATRQLANRRIDPVFRAGNMRVDGWKVLPDTPVAPAQHHSSLCAFPIENRTFGANFANIFSTARYANTEHDGVNTVAIIQVVAQTDHHLFTGLLPTAFTKRGVKFVLVTRFSNFKSIKS
jgi:hypothetical protein